MEYNPINLPGRFSHLTGRNDVHHGQHVHKSKDNPLIAANPAVVPTGKQPPVIFPAATSGVPSEDQYLCQRFVIFERDDKGYGLTVSGDNPVFVQSVKEDGPAYLAGVQKGDRIVKVNEVLVTQCNHTEVVRLIKGNAFVALTLLGQSPTKLPTLDTSGRGGGKPATMAPPITSPQPADPTQQQTFSDNRLQTMNAMREKEMQNIFQLTKEFQVNPSEKLQVDLDAALKRVKQLQEQIFVLSFRRNQAATGQSQTSPTGRAGPLSSSALAERPLPPLPLDMAMAPGRVSRKNSGANSHTRQLSTPEPLHISAALSLPMSDGTPHNRSLTDLIAGKSDDFSAKSLPPSIPVMPRKTSDGDRKRTFSSGDSGTAGSSRLSVGPAGSSALTNGPSVSDRKVPFGTFPGISVPRGRQLDILSMDESSHAAADQQRPFMHYLTLQRHLPHLAVFIHYLISSADPSSLLFHFLSEYYTKGTAKEMLRWAYELHSTFLVPGAPLEIECVKHFPSLVSHVDDILDKIEKIDDNQLKDLFNTVRNRALDTVKNQLAEFQQKKVLGLATLFGPSETELDEAERSTDKTRELVGEILGKILDSISLASPEEPENRSDRQAAIGCAVASVMKLTSARLKEKDGITLADRWPSFLQKDKNKFKLKDKTKKALSIAGHQFSPVTCSSVASCNQCREVLWGVAPQGYQCAFCDYITHRGCAKSVEESCVGKKVNRAGFPSAMEDFFNFRKRSNQNPVAIASAKRLHEDGEDSAPSSLPDSLDGGFKRPDSSLARRLAESKSPDRSDTPGSSPSMSRSESLRGNRNLHAGTAGSRKKSDPTHLDREESEHNHRRGNLTGASESSSGSTPSLRNSESPMASSETMDVVQCENDSDFEADPDSMPSWQSYLPSLQIVEKLDERNRKRQDVIAELFHTERTHVRNLKVLRLVFYGPMTRDNLLPPELASQVFANLDEMIEMHSQLNRSMREMRKSKSLIGKVGDLLLSRFDGEPGHQFKMAAAAFCRNQSSGLEALKLRQKKDLKLAAFLAEAEANPLCRRLQLKDLLPAGMQRLTKYPLLLGSLLKYTSPDQDEDKEYEKVFVSLNSSREILEFVNQAVKESGNQNRLRDLQDKIDMGPYRKTQSKLGLQHKHIDLSDYRLLMDGDLTWRYNKQKTIDLRVILLNKSLLIVTRQEDKLTLKFHNNPQGSSGGDKKTSGQYENSRYWTPVLTLEQLTVKDVANDPRAFFLYWQGSAGAHMYELVAASNSEQKQWVREIRAAIDGLSGCVDIMSAFPQTATVSVTSSSSVSTDAESPEDEPAGDQEDDEFEEGHSGPRQPSQQEKRSLEGYRESKRRKSMSVLTSPSAVVVTQMDIMDAELVLTPFEQLKRRDKQLQEALQDKKRLVSSILGISEDATTSTSKETTPVKENPCEAKTLVYQAMQQCNQLTELVTDGWAFGNTDLYQQMQPESQTSEPTTSGRRSSSAQTKTSVPLLDANQLEEIAVTLNRQLASLMSAVCLREDENERLRKELQHAKEQVKILRSETRSPSPGITLQPVAARPTSFGDDKSAGGALLESASGLANKENISNDDEKKVLRDGM